MNQFLLGATAMGCLAAGLFFLRYWRSTGDRFFLFFMLAFWIEALGRAEMAIHQSWNEDTPGRYLLRLLGYGFILFAIWDKNRKRSSGPGTPQGKR